MVSHSSTVSIPRLERVAPGVARLRTLIANVFFVSSPGDPRAPWCLVDAGVGGHAAAIRRAAWALYGDRPPSAILLTHGHFDHVGSLRKLLREWEVPVYAHPLEFPYLTGQRPYPPPDPGVGGGMLSRLSFLYPRGPIDVGPRLLALPPDGVVPTIEGWQWHHSPGHSPGHVSFFRTLDRVLIAGDAMVTTRQESAASVVFQREQLRPPPAYFTLDWAEAAASVRRLARLDPHVLATGHGPTISGELLDRQLRVLTERFEMMIPRRGRYVERPAHPEHEPASFSGGRGVASRLAWPLATGALVIVAGLLWSGHHRRRHFTFQR
jgi:glyoxylase-like metal-dependent hydrolase (beta-lactamase superfamily II)